MSGALDSGMDIVIELSGEYFEQIVREMYGEIKICLAGEHVIDNNRVRDLVPVIHDVQLIQEDSAVKISLILRAMYGKTALGDGWINIPEDHDIPLIIGLGTRTTDSGAELTFDTSELPDEVRANLGEISSKEISLDFLRQAATVNLPDREPVQVWDAAVTGEPLLKVVDGNLIIGLDVELSQDEDLLEDRGFVPVYRLTRDWPAGTPRICYLPEQPIIDRNSFDEFADSFVNGNDWALALDAHIVKAIFQAQPSVDLNRPGEDDECGPKGGMRLVCLTSELDNDIIHVRGEGSIFVCPEIWVWFIDFAPDDWYGIDFRADVTLSVSFTELTASYRLTSASINGEDHLRDIEEDYPELFSGDISLPLGNTFGDGESDIGELRVTDVDVFANGLVFRGIGSVQPREPVINVPESLLFATHCNGAVDETLEGELTISGDAAPLHICPLVIHGHDADSFSIIGPAALEQGECRPDDPAQRGCGVTIKPGSRLHFQVRLTGESGQDYSAYLDIPNNAERRTVELIGNLQRSSVSLEPEELQLTRTDSVGLCTGEYPPAGSISGSVILTNSGPGNLRICSVEISSNDVNPDGIEVFRLVEQPPQRILAVDEQVRIRVNFRPRESGVGQDFGGTLRIVTNAETDDGSHDVALIGHLGRSIDWDSDGLAGSFVTTLSDPYGFFCGKADWDYIRKFGGRILDPRTAEEFLSILGGGDGPAGPCFDLWEIAFNDVPRDVCLEVVDKGGQAIATNRSRSLTRILMAPIKEGNGYTLRAKIPQSAAGAQSSPMTMRRWFAQQDGLYTTSQRFSDLTVAGEYAYAVGSSGMEVISLTELESPLRVALMSGPAGATSIVALGNYLLVAKDRLRVYSLADPQRPKQASSLALNGGIRALLTIQISDRTTPLAYAVGEHLHTLDVSDPEHPRKVSSVTVQVHANRVLGRSNRLYLFGKEGMEVFDLSKPDMANSMGFLPTQGEVRNALLMEPFVMLIYDSRAIDMVDVSKPNRPRLAGGWQLESWIEEYVPLAGSFVRYKGHFLMLNGDQLGFRVIRMRRNMVNQEKLCQWRNQRSGERRSQA